MSHHPSMKTRNRIAGLALIVASTVSIVACDATSTNATAQPPAKVKTATKPTHTGWTNAVTGEKEDGGVWTQWYCADDTLLIRTTTSGGSQTLSTSMVALAKDLRCTK